MYQSNSQAVGEPQRYSARKSAQPINFTFFAPAAKHVSLIGDFNDWHPNVHPMKRQPDGGWHIQVPLCHGHHKYLYLVDGVPTLDNRAQGTVRNKQNERVSLIAVS